MPVDRERTIHFHQRILVRLVVPIATLLVLLSSALAAFVWVTYRDDQIAADEVPKAIVLEVKENILLFFDRNQLNLSLAAQSMQDADLSSEQRSFLEQIVTSETSIIEMIVLDEARQEVFRTSEATTGIVANIQSEALKKSIDRVFATRRPDVIEPQETAQKTPYIVWSMPILSDTNNVVGAISMTVDISTLWQDITNATPRDVDSHIFIADQSGNILVSNKSLENTDYASRLGDILRRVTDESTTRRYLGLLGEWVVGKGERLPPTTWVAVAEVSLSDVTETSRRNFIIFAAAMFLFALLLFYTFYAFHYNLIRPLTTFRRAITELSMGNYATRIRISTLNELTLLADIMNEMAASIELQANDNVVKLKQTIADLDRSAHTLMKRDEELSRANDRLLRLDHAKSEFVSIAAHQLRTPLSALKWAQQMLLDGEAGQVSDSQRLLLTQSQESVRRMVTLVNDLLAADHLEYGKVAYDMKSGSPEEILTSCALELKPMADEHRITLAIELPVKSQAMVDQERIKEAFLNVLNNAIKYSPDGGTVTLRANYGMGKVVLSIQDTGIGIPEGDRDRLFEKFVRMENAKKVDANGSGLGLFIVKKVIDAHAGKIWFTSSEGQGSTFYIELPVVNN
jgi:signal transduction histidine kinase